MDAPVQKEKHMNPTARDSSDYAIGLIASHTTPKLLTLFVLASGAALALAPAPVFAQDAGYSCTDRSGAGSRRCVRIPSRT